MQRYSPPTPMLAFDIAAALMTGLVLTLAVYLPTKLSPGPVEVLARATARGHIEVDIVPSRIEVIGTRETTTASSTLPVAAVLAAETHRDPQADSIIEINDTSPYR